MLDIIDYVTHDLLTDQNYVELKLCMINNKKVLVSIILHCLNNNDHYSSKIFTYSPTSTNFALTLDVSMA